MPSNHNLDDTDLALREELQADARVSLAELGRRVGLSAPSVAERMRRLETDGVILGYRAQVDPRALGYDLSAVLRVRPDARQLPKLAKIAADTPEVTECERVTGADGFVMKLHGRDLDHPKEVLHRF